MEATAKKRYELTESEIEFIRGNTDLSREEIERWFGEFRARCVDGRLDPDQFLAFYARLFRGGGGGKLNTATQQEKHSPEMVEYGRSVFGAFDTDHSGSVDFAEFVIGFWVRARGSLRDKLAWLFGVYDADRTGYIAQWRLIRAVELLYAIKGINNKSKEGRDDDDDVEEEPYSLVTRLFRTADRNGDGRLSREEFIAGCMRDEKLRRLLAPF